MRTKSDGIGLHWSEGVARAQPELTMGAIDFEPLSWCNTLSWEVPLQKHMGTKP